MKLSSLSCNFISFPNIMIRKLSFLSEVIIVKPTFQEVRLLSAFPDVSSTCLRWLQLIHLLWRHRALSVRFTTILKLRVEHLPQRLVHFPKTVGECVHANLSSPEKHVTAASLVKNAFLAKKEMYCSFYILRILKIPKPTWKYFCKNLYNNVST